MTSLYRHQWQYAYVYRTRVNLIITCVDQLYTQHEQPDADYVMLHAMHRMSLSSNHIHLMRLRLFVDLVLDERFIDGLLIVENCLKRTHAIC